MLKDCFKKSKKHSNFRIGFPMLKREFVLDMAGKDGIGPLFYYFHRNIQTESQRIYIELNVIDRSANTDN